MIVGTSKTAGKMRARLVSGKIGDDALLLELFCPVAEYEKRQPDFQLIEGSVVARAMPAGGTQTGNLTRLPSGSKQPEGLRPSNAAAQGSGFQMRLPNGKSSMASSCPARAKRVGD